MNYQALIEAVQKHGDLTDQNLRDAAEHGADGGFNGFTYYVDTTRFYDENEALIWDLLEDIAEGCASTPLELLAQFNCAKGITDLATFKNALAWFALEEAGRELLNPEVA